MEDIALLSVDADVRSIARWARTAAAAATLPAFGQPIAWATCRNSYTDGLSELHRVGALIGGEPHTTCGTRIPEPVLWVSLSERMIRTMPKCRWCEHEHAQHVAGLIRSTSEASHAA